MSHRLSSKTDLRFGAEAAVRLLSSAQQWIAGSRQVASDEVSDAWVPFGRPRLSRCQAAAARRRARGSRLQHEILRNRLQHGFHQLGVEYLEQPRPRRRRLGTALERYSGHFAATGMNAKVSPFPSSIPVPSKVPASFLEKTIPCCCRRRCAPADRRSRRRLGASSRASPAGQVRKAGGARPGASGHASNAARAAARHSSSLLPAAMQVS